MKQVIRILLLLPIPLLANGFCFRGIDGDIGIGASAYTLNIDTATSNSPVGTTGFAAGFDIGGSWTCNCWLLGVQGFGQYNNTEASIHHANLFDIVYKMPWDVGIEGKIGLIAAPNILFYGVVGGDWGWNQFKENTSTASVDTTKLHTGLRVGAGGEQRIFKCIFIRESFAYTWFNSKHYTSATGTLEKITPHLTTTLFTVGILF